MPESTELATVEPQELAVQQFGTIDPEQTMSKAIAVADTLAQIVKRRPEMVVRVENKAYPTVECWTTMGAMLGVFPFVEWTKESGRWGDPADPYVVQARVQARTAAGNVIGAGEGMCRADETLGRSGPRWRDAYAVLSMAQTRAISKALRMPLGWVLKLAGMESTPAEEVPPGGFHNATEANVEVASEVSLLSDADMSRLLTCPPEEVNEDQRRAFVWTAALRLKNGDHSEAETLCRSWGSFKSKDGNDIRGPLPWDISKKDGSLQMKTKWLNQIWDRAKKAYVETLADFSDVPLMRKKTAARADENQYKADITAAALEITEDEGLAFDLLCRWIKEETGTETNINKLAGLNLVKVKARSDEELNRHLNKRAAIV